MGAASGNWRLPLGPAYWATMARTAGVLHRREQAQVLLEGSVVHDDAIEEHSGHAITQALLAAWHRGQNRGTDGLKYLPSCRWERLDVLVYGLRRCVHGALVCAGEIAKGTTNDEHRPRRFGAADDHHTADLRRLTFELTPRAVAGGVSPVRDDATPAADRAYATCRSESGVERVVRPRRAPAYGHGASQIGVSRARANG